MHSGLVILSVFLAVSLSHAAIHNVFNFEIPKAQKTKFSDIINNLVGRYHIPQNDKQSQKPDLFNILMNGGKLKQKVNGFEYKDCGGFAGKITNLQLSPDPLEFPGNINVLATVDLKEELSSPLMVNISVEKDGQPFLCNILPCNFPDVCTMLANVSPCPAQLEAAGIPCQCPFKKKIYSLPLTTFEIDAEVLPEGNYHMIAAVYSGGKKAACLDLKVTLAY